MAMLNKENLARGLRRLLSVLEENNRTIQTGKVKQVIFEKKKTKEGKELPIFRKGMIVFTKDGVGTVTSPKWRSDSVYSQQGKVYVMLRKKSKKVKIYSEEDLFRLVVEDEQGTRLNVSPMFYDHLIATIDKDVKYTVNLRKVAMLTEKQQAILEKDRLASLKGAYHLIRFYKENNLW